MSLPLINTTIDNIIYGSGEDGRLLYMYSPFQNLKISTEDGYTDLDDLRIEAYIASIDVSTPISLDTEVSYDGSVNLIVNDYTNPLKIVNSRFYLTDSDNYKIADRKGNLDTNIYTAENFIIEAGLIKTVRSLTSIHFLGLDSGGILPVGNYTFYFKLADSDGNESDFIAESGKVVCHIGSVNDPTSIRGGLLEENSDKVIKFRLDNIDLAYNYIHIYYTKSTGDEKVSSIRTFKISDKFKINGINTEVAITGYETHEGIDNSEINLRYASFDSAQTNENCQDITFVGNTTKDYEVFKSLEKLSLLITPSISTSETIGNLNYKYKETYSPEDGYEYYNAKNIYYKLGYWDEEIYRAGIVYVMNDYTLSPVFNIRGIKDLTADTLFTPYTILDTINITEDYLIEDSVSSDNPENSKGVFRINNLGDSANPTFLGAGPIRPIGLKFNFTGHVLSNLKELTRGFFIVRQKRIPTLLAQGIGIGTSSKAYFPVIKTANYISESFLTSDNAPLLKRDFFEIPSSYVRNNALLCPEASLRPYIFNNFFNSSEFTLIQPKYETFDLFTDKSGNKEIFTLDTPTKKDDTDINTRETISSDLLLVEPGIGLINNGDIKFSSKAGDSMQAWTHADPLKGDINDLYTDPEDPENPGTSWTDDQWSNSVSKVRGEFNTYVGSSKDLAFGAYYNIFQKDYEFDTKWKNYFKIRYNDSSPFMAISDRYSWDKIGAEVITYRGDCYINTYAHRMNWNFIDPELPTNDKVIDPWNWFKNYRVRGTTVKVAGSVVMDDSDDGTTDQELIGQTAILTYKKVLDIFTYKSTPLLADIELVDGLDISAYKIALPDAKKFAKYAEANGTFGTQKLNRPDINGIPLGHWATFKICSNVNLAMRDVDFSRPEEEAIHGTKRKFHPIQKASHRTKLPESNIINSGVSNTLGNKSYFEIPDVPFIKDTFTTRIHYSNVLADSAFKNGHRVFKGNNFQDYTLEHGELVKLIDWYGKLVAVMEHGVLMIPVNERAMMQNTQGEDVYINTANVLPKNPKVLSNTFGSVWADSIIKTSRFVYGIDTIAKKVWRTNGEVFELISDLKIQKFLNDRIHLKSIQREKTPGEYGIKTHYNSFKSDILFVFKYGEEKWHLCWNELLEKWVTQYSWFPEFSENINNIFYTFANRNLYSNKGNILYKHGFAGNEEELGNILPTMWYDSQETFEYEFVVIGTQGVQKIFDNLKIISNLTEPDEFYYEIVGEGFDWVKQKKDIYTFTTDQEFIDYLTANPAVKKVPYIKANPDFVNSTRPDTQLRDLTIREHNKTKEKLVDSFQNGYDIKENGRIKGNMQYVEDFWDVQIQPITFKYAYLNDGELAFTNNSEMRIRDKYIKIRVKYDGANYAIINALSTFFTISYA